MMLYQFLLLFQDQFDIVIVFLTEYLDVLLLADKVVDQVAHVVHRVGSVADTTDDILDVGCSALGCSLGLWPWRRSLWFWGEGGLLMNHEFSLVRIDIDPVA